MNGCPLEKSEAIGMTAGMISDEWLFRWERSANLAGKRMDRDSGSGESFGIKLAEVFHKIGDMRRKVVGGSYLTCNHVLHGYVKLICHLVYDFCRRKVRELFARVVCIERKATAFNECFYCNRWILFFDQLFRSGKKTFYVHTSIIVNRWVKFHTFTLDIMSILT